MGPRPDRPRKFGMLYYRPCGKKIFNGAAERQQREAEVSYQQYNDGRPVSVSRINSFGQSEGGALHCNLLSIQDLQSGWGRSHRTQGQGKLKRK